MHEPNKAFQIRGGGICPGGMCPRGYICPGGKCPRGKCPGGYILCPGVSVRGVHVWEGFVLSPYIDSSPGNADFEVGIPQADETRR